MERFNSDLYLTTSQVAELLSVHPSTVKRWCNDGELDSEKTEGGHRRIHLDDVLALASERGESTFLDPFEPFQPHVWSSVRELTDRSSVGRIHSLAMGWLKRGHLDRVGELIVTLGRRPDLPLTTLLDDVVRGFMVQVGEAWREGRLRIGEEHMASQTVIEALLRLRGAITADIVPRGDRKALVGSMEGDQHHLGSLCVRLLLEREGWTVYYMGADVPVEDFAAMQWSRRASLVCVSFSSLATPADMKRCVRILAQFYKRSHPFSLALGGPVGRTPLTEGMPPLPFVQRRYFRSVEELQASLRAGFGHPGVAEMSA